MATPPNSSSPVAPAAKRKNTSSKDAYGRLSKKKKSDATEEDLWEESVLRCGRAFTRTGDMWTRPVYVINAGLQAQDEADEAEENEDEDEAEDPVAVQHPPDFDLFVRSYGKLKKQYGSNFEKDLLTRKEKMESLLLAAAKSARQSDTNTIKKGLGEYHNFEPSIAGFRKSQRGHNHVATGRLLNLPGLDYNNPEHVERLQKNLEESGPGTYYTFMYARYEITPSSLFKGLLRSELLVKAYKAIFFGPSAATATEGPSTSDSTKATRANNATLGGITEVTPGAIAYITTLVRFALSSESTLTAGDENHFDNCGYYRVLVDLLEGPTESALRKKFRRELLAWWNVRCFPRTATPAVGQGMSTHAMLLAQEAAANEEGFDDLPDMFD